MLRVLITFAPSLVRSGEPAPGGLPPCGGHQYLASIPRLSTVTDDQSTLVVWLPVTIVNGLNRRQHWTIAWHRARAQRDAVGAAVLAALGGRRFAVPPSRPKVVEFHAFVGKAFDLDGLQAALKHVRDGLQDCGVIQSDGPNTGHVFVYHQTPGAQLAERGVRMVIRLG